MTVTSCHSHCKEYEIGALGEARAIRKREHRAPSFGSVRRVTDPPLLRPDEPQDDLTRNQNRELARRQALGDLSRPNDGGGAGFVLLVLPWLFVAAAVFVLATWFSARVAGLRELLESTPLDARIADAADGAGGEPGYVVGVIVAVVAVAVLALTLLRRAFWRRWFERGGRARTLRSGIWALTMLRSMVVVLGVALAGVAGGIARGADLDPEFRPTDVAGWWPWVVVLAACLWVSLGSVRRTTDKVAARIAAVVAASAPPA